MACQAIRTNKGFKEWTYETKPASLTVRPVPINSFLLMAHRESTVLCTLSEWSVGHIRDVFEARSEEKCLRAIAATFSDGVNASINGMPLSREGINQLVLAMRRSSESGLKVYWQKAIEVPRDAATNRVSLTCRCDDALTIAYIK